MAWAKQISRAGNGQGALAERTEACTLRTWDASDESLRNFTGKTHEKGNCPHCSFASFGASFRALSGASSDASEEAFVFRLADVWHRAQALRNNGDRKVKRTSKDETKHGRARHETEDGCASRNYGGHIRGGIVVEMP